MVRCTAMRALRAVTACAAVAALTLAGASPAMADTKVVAWTHGDVKAKPANKERRVSHVSPGFAYHGICWTYGEPVAIPGSIEQDYRWVRLRLRNGGIGYVPGAYLQGNDTGGVPNQC